MGAQRRRRRRRTCSGGDEQHAHHGGDGRGGGCDGHHRRPRRPARRSQQRAEHPRGGEVRSARRGGRRGDRDDQGRVHPGPARGGGPRPARGGGDGQLTHKGCGEEGAEAAPGGAARRVVGGLAGAELRLGDAGGEGLPSKGWGWGEGCAGRCLGSGMEGCVWMRVAEMGTGCRWVTGIEAMDSGS
jgi:hypothetical protein